MLLIKDFAATNKFYTETLGFSRRIVMQDANGNDNFAIYAWGEPIQIGAGMDVNTPVSAPASVQFMIYVPDGTDIDQYYADVKARGGTVGELKTEYWGDRLFDVYDPDGYWLSFCKTVKQMSEDEIRAADVARREA